MQILAIPGFGFGKQKADRALDWALGKLSPDSAWSQVELDSDHGAV